MRRIVLVVAAVIACLTAKSRGVLAQQRDVIPLASVAMLGQLTPCDARQGVGLAGGAVLAQPSEPHVRVQASLTRFGEPHKSIDPGYGACGTAGSFNWLLTLFAYIEWTSVTANRGSLLAGVGLIRGFGNGQRSDRVSLGTEVGFGVPWRNAGQLEVRVQWAPWREGTMFTGSVGWSMRRLK